MGRPLKPALAPFILRNSTQALATVQDMGDAIPRGASFLPVSLSPGISRTFKNQNPFNMAGGMFFFFFLTCCALAVASEYTRHWHLHVSGGWELEAALVTASVTDRVT